MAEAFNFGNPTNPDNADGSNVYVFGCEWDSSTPGSVTGGRWRRPTNPPTGNLYMLLYEKGDTNPLASKLFTLPGVGDNDILFDSPVSIAAGVRYISAVLSNRYAFTSGGWPFATLSLTAPAGVNGRLVQTVANTPAYPSNVHGGAANFFIGPLFEPTGSVTVRPTILAVPNAVHRAGSW